MLDGTENVFQKAKARHASDGREVEVFESGLHDARNSITYNTETGDVRKYKLYIPFRNKSDSVETAYHKHVTRRHEVQELNFDKGKIHIVKPGNSGQVIIAKRGLGTHESMGVLGHEQVALRDAPDEVYKYYKDLRLNGNGINGRDWKKVEALKERHGVDVVDYGSDLRYRPKEVKHVDAVAFKDSKARAEKLNSYQNLYDGISSTHSDKADAPRLHRMAQHMKNKIDNIPKPRW